MRRANFKPALKGRPPLPALKDRPPLPALKDRPTLPALKDRPTLRALRIVPSSPRRGRADSGPVPPVEVAARGPVSLVKLTCDDIEVTQSIQNLPGHGVPLVANKRTVVRVYLSAKSAAPIMVLGLLKVRRTSPASAWSVVGAMGPVTINPAENGQLRLKRESESKSLNFAIPPSLLGAGPVEFRLAVVYQVSPFRLMLPPANARRTVTLLASPPLRVRIVGIRFQGGSPPAAIEPNPLDFALIRSWLERAYPVASVEWAQVIVDGPQAWPFDASTINAFVRAIRTADVLGGVDARTHYYGLVSDGGGSFFMRGLASGIPNIPDPSTVASGPTGVNTWGWDLDGSYGDWYTGHELGHTFGRLHAMFCGALGGGPYPFVNGQLSNADGAFVGFDVGDTAHGLPARALPGTMWHDVMTYCSFQWLSSFTYTGIRDRLVLEDALPSSRTASARRRRGRQRAAPMTAGTVHVIATVNLTRGTGNIRHVTAVDAPPPGQSEARSERPRSGDRRRADPAVALRISGSGGRAIVEYPATVILDACQDPGDDRTGIVDAFLPASERADRIELLMNGSVIDAFTSGPSVSAPRNIASAAPQRRARAGARSADAAANPVITWAEGGSAAGRARAAALGSGRTYTVQVSTDDGASWQTVGFGLRDPRVTIDRQVLGAADTVRVRVIATDGFRSASSEKTFKAADL
jgi:hypothetical protein